MEKDKKTKKNASINYKSERKRNDEKESGYVE